MRSQNQRTLSRSNQLTDRARSMLHAPTASEEALWLALRGGALGVAFKRQVVLGERYIADFFAPSAGLVVEVDGDAHRASRAADCRRDERLRRLGYRVVRVEAALVLRDQARLKRALAIARDIDRQRAVVSQDGLGARAITVIGRIVWLAAPGRVPEMVGQLAA